MIIWDSLKINNGTTVLTFTPAGAYVDQFKIYNTNGSAAITFDPTSGTVTGIKKLATPLIAGFTVNGVVTATKFVGGVSGTVAGNVIGNVRGDLTGNVTGNINGGGTFNGILSNASGTLTTATVTNLNVGSLSLTQSVNLPAGSTIGGESLSTSKLYTTRFAVLASAKIGWGSDFIDICNGSNQKLYCHVRQNNTPNWEVVNTRPSRNTMDFYLKPFETARIFYDNIDSYKTNGYLYCQSGEGSQFTFKLSALVEAESYIQQTKTVDMWYDSKILKLAENSECLLFVYTAQLEEISDITNAAHVLATIKTLYDLDNILLLAKTDTDTNNSDIQPLLLYGIK